MVVEARSKERLDAAFSNMIAAKMLQQKGQGSFIMWIGWFVAGTLAAMHATVGGASTRRGPSLEQRRF